MRNLFRALAGIWRQIPSIKRTPVMEGLECRTHFSAVGVAFYGLSAAPAGDATYVAHQFDRYSGNHELSFLPFEFNPSQPFANATTFVDAALPQSKGKLIVAIDLKWFAHKEASQQAAQNAFWAAWQASKPSAAQKAIEADFLGRVQTADQWVATARSFAASQNLTSRLTIVYVPVLEDTDASSTAYARMLNAIKSQENSDGIALTAFRRSLEGYGHVFRPSGVSLELHGTWADASKYAKAGDTWSNDGTPYAIGSFVSDEKAAAKVVTGIHTGVSALYWDSDMNGDPNVPNTDPYSNWDKRTVNPFSGGSASANDARLASVLGM
jgi:hypothetical protein